MKICGYFFFFLGGGGGSIRNRTFFFFFFFFWGGGGHFFTLYGVLRSKYRMGIIFWAANFQIFLGIPDIPDFFF